MDILSIQKGIFDKILIFSRKIIDIVPNKSVDERWVLVYNRYILLKREEKQMKLEALLHKVYGTTPNDGNLQPKEAIAYGIAGFGQT